MSSINATLTSVLSYQPTVAETEKNNKESVSGTVIANPVTAKEKSEKVVDKDELLQAVEVLNQAVSIQQRALSFSVDDASGRSVIKVVDYETDELIKQIPTEELLKVARHIKQLQDEVGQSIGLLIDNKV